MGLDVYLRGDIANVLRATACASDGSVGLATELLSNHDGVAGEPGGLVDGPEQERFLQAYRLGVRNTLLAVGLAFGLEPVVPRGQGQPEVLPALAGLLWAEVHRE